MTSDALVLNNCAMVLAATIRAMSDANIDLNRKLRTVCAATVDIKKLCEETNTRMKNCEKTNSQILQLLINQQQLQQ